MSRRLTTELDKRLRVLEDSLSPADEPSNIILYPMGISEEELARMVSEGEEQIREYRHRMRGRKNMQESTGAMLLIPIKGSFTPAVDNNKDIEE